MDNNYYFKILCTNIRILRVKNQLSIRDMAKILGIGVNSLRKIEAGEIPPRLGCNMLFRMRDHFKISISSLFAPLPGMEKFY